MINNQHDSVKIFHQATMSTENVFRHCQCQLILASNPSMSRDAIETLVNSVTKARSPYVLANRYCLLSIHLSPLSFALLEITRKIGGAAGKIDNDDYAER